MRIAQVAPLFESVPPRLYGGTERVVSYLTEELVRQGHDVTLFASGDSATKARLVSPCDRSKRLDGKGLDWMATQALELERLCSLADEFDVAHFHTDYIHYPIARRHEFANLTTLHGRLDIPGIHPLFQEFRDLPFASVSFAQRKPLPFVNWQATVYHGLPEDLYRFRPRHDGYLAFLGRISPEKRVDHAIAVAERVGMPIKIAAKVDAADQDYYEGVKDLLSHPLVEFVGEICDSDKQEFLGNAYALLFTIDWPEPFGLVMIESMACGTPVIAYPGGAVPEVVEHGVSGFIVNGVEQAAAAVGRVEELDRRECRGRFEQRFSACRMAEDYVRVYERLLMQQQPAPRQVVNV